MSVPPALDQRERQLLDRALARFRRPSAGLVPPVPGDCAHSRRSQRRTGNRRMNTLEIRGFN